MDLLRFITCGSVDDGKSTLIGRLLYDSQAISPDILAALEHQSRQTDNGAIDLALLTDGLRSEREQGITIDVAYKYFATQRRKFIIADTPGHVQYTRNMVTGASNADLAIILIDVRHGVVEQTRRHAAIVSLLGISNVVVCVNKMDLVAYAKKTFDDIVDEYRSWTHQLAVENLSFIPVSALTGDNIVSKSEEMPWYEGPSLLTLLETIDIRAARQPEAPRFQVQWVIRPQTEALHDYRGYAGQIQSGVYKKGDRVLVLPSGQYSTIKTIEVNQKATEEAFAPQPVVIHLQDDVDVDRGAYIVPVDAMPIVSQDLEATLCITHNVEINIGARFLLQHHSAVVKCAIKEISSKLNYDTLDMEPDPEKIQLNDIVKVRLRTASPLAFDPYVENRRSGAFILVDERSGHTIAAGLLMAGVEVS